MSILTLLTDFGTQDTYIGVMKGVIFGICSTVTIVDLTHDVAPQDVVAGRFHLESAYRYFPSNTVHLVVIDPGVGSDRRSIAFETAQGIFIGPDNGVMTGIHDSPIIVAVELDRPQYWRTSSPSSTFHGRDIFASVAGHLSAGVAIQALGSTIEVSSLVCFPELFTVNSEGKQQGIVQSVDRFGNLITNLRLDLNLLECWNIHLPDHILPIQKNYSESGVGQLVAIVGSHGFVEIAVNCGNAQERLGIRVGDRIAIDIKGNR
ncbi:MAG: SAM-dependent chlorinase/fluorinase [Alkalinema sp. CAN_BIN05]|nr:SAM-dependent chlorinase/fluorinase [Alkalinema sp. CAN_BIN05]